MACYSVKRGANPILDEELNALATRYTAAWCSQNASSVAAFFAPEGSLKINEGTPCIGRPAITGAVQGFMSAFPDLVVTMDKLSIQHPGATYHWTLTGTNTGPEGTGNSVRISGYEIWRFAPDSLITESTGHFNEAEYECQLYARR